MADQLSQSAQDWLKSTYGLSNLDPAKISYQDPSGAPVDYNQLSANISDWLPEELIDKAVTKDLDIFGEDDKPRTYSKAEAKRRSRLLGPYWHQQIEVAPGVKIAPDAAVDLAERYGPTWRKKYQENAQRHKSESISALGSAEGMPPELRFLSALGTGVGVGATAIPKALASTGEVAPRLAAGGLDALVTGASTYLDPLAGLTGIAGGRAGEFLKSIKGAEKIPGSATLPALMGSAGYSAPNIADEGLGVRNVLELAGGTIPGTASTNYAKKVRPEAATVEIGRLLERSTGRDPWSLISKTGTMPQEAKAFSQTLRTALEKKGVTTVENPQLAGFLKEADALDIRLTDSRQRLERSQDAIGQAETAERMAHSAGTQEQKDLTSKAVADAKEQYGIESVSDAAARVEYEKKRFGWREMVRDAPTPEAASTFRKRLQELDDQWRIDHAVGTQGKTTESAIAAVAQAHKALPVDASKNEIAAVQSSIPVFREDIRAKEREKLLLSQIVQNAKVPTRLGPEWPGLDEAEFAIAAKITRVSSESAKLGGILVNGTDGYKVAAKLAGSAKPELDTALMNHIVRSSTETVNGKPGTVINYSKLAANLQNSAEVLSVMLPGKNADQIRTLGKEIAEVYKDISENQPKSLQRVLHSIQSRMSTHMLLGVAAGIGGTALGQTEMGGHAGTAGAIAGTALAGELALLRVDKFVKDMMTNDALRTSALAWSRAGGGRQQGRLSGDAGQLFMNYLRSSGKPLRASEPSE